MNNLGKLGVMAIKISLLALTVVFFGISTSTAAAKDGPTRTIRLSMERAAVEYLVAKPISDKKRALSDWQCILPVFPRQSHFPQPIIIQNYYLTAQAKKEILPFWHGPRPLRLRNQFIK
jgi:hypothetical protein